MLSKRLLFVLLLALALPAAAQISWRDRAAINQMKTQLDSLRRENEMLHQREALEKQVAVLSTQVEGAIERQNLIITATLVIALVLLGALLYAAYETRRRLREFVRAESQRLVARLVPEQVRGTVPSLLPELATKAVEAALTAKTPAYADAWVEKAITNYVSDKKLPRRLKEQLRKTARKLETEFIRSLEAHRGEIYQLQTLQQALQPGPGVEQLATLPALRAELQPELEAAQQAILSGQVLPEKQLRLLARFATRAELHPAEAQDYDDPWLLAMAHLAAGRTGQALRVLEMARATNPDNARLIFWHGVTLWRSQKFSDALPHLDAAVAKLPDFAAGYYVRAQVLMELGQPENAALDLTECLALQPGHIGALSTRGVAHAHMGEYKKALDDLTAAETAVPLSEAALLAQATALLGQGQFPQGTQALQKLIQDDPLNYPVLGLLALAQLAQGQHSQAESLILRATALAQGRDEQAVLALLEYLNKYLQGADASLAAKELGEVGARSRSLVQPLRLARLWAQRPKLLPNGQAQLWQQALEQLPVG